MYKYLLVFWLITGFCLAAMAQKPKQPKTQQDTSVNANQDTVIAKKIKPKKEEIYHPDSTHSPHKAVIRSLMVPGWGQVYNKRWWKVPLVYGGLGGFGYFIVWNNTYYQEFLALSKYLEHGTAPVKGDKYYSEYQLYKNQPAQAIYDANDYYRRNRDLCILGFVGFWGINVADAYIDAKFIHSYTVDNNLSVKVAPGLLNQQSFVFQNPASSYIPGIKITFTLR